MRWTDKMRLRLRTMLRRNRVDIELDRELRFHLDQQIDENIAAGMPPDEARFAALRTVGNVTHLQEQCRDARGLHLLEDATRDAVCALRSFRRSPGFAAAAVLTLALGIGATTAVYSAIDAAFFRPLPFPQSDQLVRVTNVGIPIDRGGPVDATTGTPADPRPARTRLEVTDLYELRNVLSHSAGYATGAANLGTGPEPVRVDVTFVTAEFFSMFRRDAALGRVFTPDETSAGGRNVAVLSDALWRTQLGGAPDIVGTTVMLDAVPYDVVGVMPADFRFPSEAQLWVPVPVPMPRSVMSGFRNFVPTQIVARLAPGVRPDTAANRLDAFRRQYLQAPAAGPPGTRIANAVVPAVVPLQQWLVGDRRTALAVLMASAGLVLLIACANAATLLLSRAATRRREIATHAVLGATRGRLLRQLLAESMILACAGAALGVLMAYAGLSMLSALIPPALAGLAPMQIDLRVLAFALVVTISTGVLFGLWPAVGASRLRLRDALQESGDTTFTGSGRLNRMLVVTQVALACLLTIGAALMLTTLRALLTIDVGMRIDRVAAARLDLPTARYGTAPARADFVQSVLERLRSAPGVEEAAAINTLPLAGEPGVGYRVDPEGGRTAEWISSPFLVVSPGYFRAMGIPLVRGRDLAWTDSEDSQAAVINRTLAQRLWPGEDAVGKQFTMAGLRTVVGIVEDARFSALAREVGQQQVALEAIGPQVYLPIQDQPQNYVAFVARSTDTVDVRALPAQIRDAVRAVDPTLPVYAAQPMEALVAETVTPQRVNTLLVGAFGALALCLAAIGVYGLLACSVAQRRREIGVRMALGAERRDVLILVVRQGLRLVGAGIVLGLAAAIATTRYLQEMLYGVTPRDPATFATVALVLMAVGIVASLAPALRAATVDPLATLRND